MPGAEELQVTLLTLGVALAALLWILPIALALGYLLARRRVPFAAVLDTILFIPLVLPPSAVGLLLLHVLGGNSPTGRAFAAIGFEPLFTWQAAAIAAGVMAFPLLLRFVIVGFQSVDRDLEGIARTLGAPPSRVFLRVTLPLAARAIAAGLLIAFARALSEFGATLMVAGNIPGRTRTLALGIFSSWLTNDEAQALRFAAISLGLALVVLVLFRKLERGLSRSA